MNNIIQLFKVTRLNTTFDGVFKGARESNPKNVIIITEYEDGTLAAFSNTQTLGFLTHAINYFKLRVLDPLLQEKFDKDEE